MIQLVLNSQGSASNMNFKVLFVGLALVCAIQAAPTSEDDLDQVVDVINETKISSWKMVADFQKKIMEPLTWLSHQVPKEYHRLLMQSRQAFDAAAAQGFDVNSCNNVNNVKQQFSLLRKAHDDQSKCSHDGESTSAQMLVDVLHYISFFNGLFDKAQKAAANCPSSIDVKDCRTQAAHGLYMEINKYNQENRAKIDATLREIDEGPARLNSCVQRVLSVFTDKIEKHLESTRQCINNIIVNTGN